MKRDFVGAVMAVPSKMDVDRGKPIVQQLSERMHSRRPPIPGRSTLPELPASPYDARTAAEVILTMKITA